MVWMCARWGGAVAPLLMMVLAYPFGWRGGFVLMSVFGAVWVWAFQARYKDSPQSDPAVNAAERALIMEGRRNAGKPAPLSWMTMLRSPHLVVPQRDVSLQQRRLVVLHILDHALFAPRSSPVGH